MLDIHVKKLSISLLYLNSGTILSLMADREGIIVIQLIVFCLIMYIRVLKDIHTVKLCTFHKPHYPLLSVASPMTAIKHLGAEFCLG